ncbi:hypothetical protein D3C77_506300 [compost metagenome]|nr:protein L [Pseudomonas sp. RW405]
MALYAPDTKKYVNQTNQPNNKHWTHVYKIGAIVPESGIYRCVTCGDEITSNKGDPFPPQNKKQHPCTDENVKWELIVMTQTTGSGK